MLIPKKQSETRNCLLNIYSFESARAAFKYILSRFPEKQVIIPAYIGYSIHEGSGVFDPIAESKNKFTFYSLEKDLSINSDYIAKILDEHQDSIFLIIHYFGFIQEDIDRIREKAQSKNILIVEDYAHSFFTFFSNPKISFDFAVFSLHKQFPCQSGGLLLSKTDLKIPSNHAYPFWRYNIQEISKKRIENYLFLQSQLKDVPGVIFLHNFLPNNIVPQTFPILLSNKMIRDNLYFSLNANGFGVISLYHELINKIPFAFDLEKFISDRILNLPVHQDTNPLQLASLVNQLKYLLIKAD